MKQDGATHTPAGTNDGRFETYIPEHRRGAHAQAGGSRANTMQVDVNAVPHGFVRLGSGRVVQAHASTAAAPRRNRWVGAPKPRKR